MRKEKKRNGKKNKFLLVLIFYLILEKINRGMSRAGSDFYLYAILKFK